MLVTLVLLTSCCPAVGAADEPVAEFLEALRTRGYFDLALEHIDARRNDSNLSQELRESLGFEQAITYLAMSKRSRTSGKRAEALGNARATLEAFAKAHPSHPLAGRANTELGKILFEHAKTLVWQMRAPPPGTTRTQLQTEARKLVAQAKAIYQKAFEINDKQLRAMPSHVGRENEALWNKYFALQTAVLSNKLQMIKCIYQDGQTYDVDSPERKAKLTEASKLFEQTYQENTKSLGGLMAQVWQGKCYEELGDVRAALGIYQQALNHRGSAVRGLQTITRRFRLACLTHEKRRDYKLAILEADTWLTGNKSLSRTVDGIGIRWEKARAHDLFAQSLTDNTEERDRQLRLALSEATTIAGTATPYRDVANQMSRRLKMQLGESDGPPKSFGDAFTLARSTRIKAIQTARRAVQEAKTDADAQKARENLRLALEDADGLLTLGLSLIDHKSDSTEVMQARYLLAYVKYERQHYFDAIVLSRFVMNYADKLDPDTAMNAAEIAIESCLGAYANAGENRTAEMRLLHDVSNAIVRQWPDGSRANQARMAIAGIHKDEQRPEEADKWYNLVPASSDRYAAAQMEAGKMWWTVLLNSSPKSGAAENSASDDREQMLSRAEKYLTTGLKNVNTPPGQPATASVIHAKLTLAEVHNERGRYPESIKQLTDGDQSVVRAIAVPDGTDRPEKGVTSRAFAGYAYRVLLRAYVGTQQIDEALTAMSEMEKIGGADTQIYVDLGRELEREIERLKSQNDTARLAQVRSSFEQFLQKVFQRQGGQNYNSLIWVGETYLGMADAMSDNPQTATEYYRRAATSYEQILNKNLAVEKQVHAVRLRLVKCRRQTGDFAGAMELVRQALAEYPRDLMSQLEAAYTLKAWGGNGRKPEMLRKAIAGDKEQKIWGWLGLGRRLQQPQHRERFLETRLAMVETRREFARIGKKADQDKVLRSAVSDIELLVQTQGELGDEWWAKFSSLHTQLQKEMGLANPKPLEKPERAVVVRRDPVPVPTPKATVAPQTEPEVQTSKPEPAGPFAWIGALVVAIGAGAGIWFMMARPRSRPAQALSNGGQPSFDKLAIKEAPPIGAPRAKKRPTAAGAQPRRPRPKKTAGGGAAAKAPDAAAAPRKKKKRPAAPQADGTQTKTKTKKSPGKPDPNKPVRKVRRPDPEDS